MEPKDLPILRLAPDAGGRTGFLVPSSKAKPPYDLCRFAANIFEEISTWEQYAHRIESFYVITDIDSNGENLMCSCPVGLKNYSCKHTVGIAIRFFRKEIPLAAKTIPLGRKRSAGRPKKVGTAYQREEHLQPRRDEDEHLHARDTF